MQHYGLIGYPLGHSFSPGYFKEKFRTEAIQATYTAYPLESITLLPELVAEKGLTGLNVTIPYKEAVLPFLHELDVHARAIGAVNCIRVRNGQLTGYNTDWTGFRESLLTWQPELPVGALVLGTGGAAKAIGYALTQSKIPYRQVSRISRKDSIGYEMIDAATLADFPLIINTTPIGTWPEINARPLLPYALLTPQNSLYDLVYNPTETFFLRSGREAGCATKNGLEMLHLQAEKSWAIWQGTAEE